MKWRLMVSLFPWCGCQNVPDTTTCTTLAS
jgi:hypothetical protein